jgi:hypothetical protein
MGLRDDVDQQVAEIVKACGGDFAKTRRDFIRANDLTSALVLEERREGGTRPASARRLERSAGLTSADVACLQLLGEAADRVGIPKFVALLRAELQRSDLTLAERHAIQVALGALAEHLAPGDGPAAAAKSATTLRDYRDALVVKHLGRPPVSAEELARVRKIVHDGRPGIAAACRNEEAAQRRARRGDD